MVIETHISSTFAITVYYDKHVNVLYQETKAQNAKSHAQYTQLCIQCLEPGFEPRSVFLIRILCLSTMQGEPVSNSA